MIETVPIAETIALGELYACSRSLFSFVNRALNQIELQAHVERVVSAAVGMPAISAVSNDIIVFRVIHRTSIAA